MAEIMTQQQHEMQQLLEHQQQVLDKLKPVRSGARRAEGIPMPTYNGKMGESLQVFLQQVQLYFSVNNINVNAAENQNHLVAMVASKLKGQAAAWYTFNQGKFGTLNALAEALQIICQVRDMSDIEQITWFVHDLVTRTREEVSYRRCTTVSKAITVALEFESSQSQ
ncbi:hypothetical protein PHMEG_00014792 [Phytophthora megakarya]|uniref:Retrotransposon gag domain-containing protein n=1 Tax=Phytophthora megakarya TaxID=4795 RepID=A0A225W322_9STRA|nr:hypothetical protein PHMEG_00014792 [Phytophthora megakarya]